MTRKPKPILADAVNVSCCEECSGVHIQLLDAAGTIISHGIMDPDQAAQVGIHLLSWAGREFVKRLGIDTDPIGPAQGNA